jgi:FHS family L-fucose permease-like MFS transporter
MSDTNKQGGMLRGKNGENYLIPFILITACFALWGFANDITNPMVKAFSKIFRMSVTDGALVQVAFYGGYFAMAFPAAMFIRKYSYKAGILLGLGLYAIGAFLFFPAKETGEYYPFLFAYFILTCGLSFLETSANPYILSMGSEETATRRLNLAQSFNPIGSLAGMYVAMNFIQAKLDPLDSAQRALLNDADLAAVKEHDLSVLITPYLIIGAVIVAMFLLIKFTRMPKNADFSHEINFIPTLKRIFSIPRYREGVIAQFFYVGAQIMCWTFIIQYGTRVFMEQGMGEKAAEVLSQKYNIVAMVIFCISRFVCTFLLRYLNAGKLLSVLALAAGCFTIGAIAFQNVYGMYCLVGISACMSLMFPTIYGIALNGLGEDAKFGAAGLIMAILGGSVLPPLQASIIDMGTIFNMPAVNVSFVLPLICFIVVMVYGRRSYEAASKERKRNVPHSGRRG